jgi:HAD superfamily 5'-nucleotidase-like hydrolase
VIPHTRIYQPLDLAAIDAVGFDLDHTLALYDDAAVNTLAAGAARRLLVERHRYPDWLIDDALPMHVPPAARALAADLRAGTIVKLNAARRVVRARHGGQWLGREIIDRHYPNAIPDDREWTYPIGAPFELPVIWLLEEIEARLPIDGDRRERCEHVRTMLDTAHTNGTLKRHLLADLGAFVSAIPGLVTSLSAWAQRGKRLFVVTNSEPDYAAAVLDLALGDAWPSLFERVVTNARKPRFFHERAVPGRPAPRGMIEGGSAVEVERALGVKRERILFVGDNVATDVRAARAHGWKAVLIAPELVFETTADPWGSPLADGGSPSWLAELARAHAHLACARVDHLLSVEPDDALAVDTGETP